MKTIATNAQHKKQNSHMVQLLSDLGRCDDEGFELISNDGVLLCQLMANEVYTNTNKCALYSASGSKTCLRCIKKPFYKTIAELKQEIADETVKRKRLNYLKNYGKRKNIIKTESVGEKEMAMNWKQGYCPKCQPDQTGETKNLLNGVCRACLNVAKNESEGSPAGAKRPYTKRTTAPTTYAPPEGYMLLKQGDIITRVMESAGRNKRDLQNELEIILERGLSMKQAPVDFDKLKRLLARRKELGTTQDHPIKAYAEAFDRVDLLIGDIQAGDI